MKSDSEPAMNLSLQHLHRFKLQLHRNLAPIAKKESSHQLIVRYFVTECRQRRPKGFHPKWQRWRERAIEIKESRAVFHSQSLCEGKRKDCMRDTLKTCRLLESIR